MELARCANAAACSGRQAVARVGSRNTSRAANGLLAAPRGRPGAAARHQQQQPLQKQRQQRQQLGLLRASQDDVQELIGEDSAAFDVEQQSTQSWVLFTVLLVGVLGLIYLVWIDPTYGLADDFVGSLTALGGSSTATMMAILAVFAAAHSGLAYLRPWGEELMGARAYRVIFALVSLPLAILAVVYFINHRYDGAALWDLRGQPGVHSAVWLTTFVSFFFLYPSTFNILEVAAVDEPKVHLWETGIIRITRHPQMVGQAMWCLAHTAWIGNSFMVATSFGLMAHHLFAVWHGDFRLKRQYGDEFEAVKARTSVWPFAAVLDGRQRLPPDFYKEFLRLPYVTITAITIGVYLSHPLMQRASYWLNW